MSSKKIAVVASAVIAAVAIAGAVFLSDPGKKTVEVKTTTTNNQGQEQTQTKKVEVTKATDIKSTVAAWKTAGLNVSTKDTPLYQMIGAKTGGEYDVNGVNVELYEFDDKNKLNSAKDYFASQQEPQEGLTIEQGTTLESGDLLIYIHSVDPARVDQIKAVF